MMNYLNKSFQPVISLSVATSLALLIACGGGGSSNNVNPSQPPSWQQGVFENEGKFKNYCQMPRSGTDSQGNVFPDKQGTTLQENHWLRAWSNNTYLWYDEIVDQDPADFSNTESYFNVLKTTALSPSGNNKDKFHFTYDSEEWEQLSQSGQSAGYGAEWTIVASAPPRKILVAFTEENAPASQAGANLERGTEILMIDNIDVINADDQASVNIINAGLFPANEGETHTFVVRDAGASTNRTVTMTSAIITSAPVRQTATIDTNNGKVGYLLFNAHIATAEEGLVDAINQLQQDNIDDLVLDLRYNGGGLLAIASQLSYMIAGANATNNKVFEEIRFNDKHTSTNPVTGRALAPTPFYNTTLGFSLTQGQSLPTLNLSRVFILSTDDTCSASESIINALRGIDVEVILIGSTTCGKPYGFYPTDNCGTTYFTIQFRGENDKGFGDYSDGFSPVNTAGTVGEVVNGCSIADDFNHLLGNPQESLLSAALTYRETGSCPTPTGVAVKHHNSPQQGTGKTQASGIAINKPIKLNDKIFGIPQ
ncbi:S41 family peptidase [Aliikangiella maris]|uniref:S41 family peptidase n=2 Tax=Aliikangiella maris TaxID=3162458 RepID=A0ABV2BR18_9GAMM